MSNAPKPDTPAAPAAPAAPDGNGANRAPDGNGATGATGATGAYESLLADIAAGTRLHYDQDDSEDPDLDLLTGDERYAEGLVKLASLGDLNATRILGDAISAIAQARAAGDVAAAQSVWEQAVAAVRRKT